MKYYVQYAEVYYIFDIVPILYSFYSMPNYCLGANWNA